ncbi:unnamed protein product [Chilo suppressalis]|uniref:Peptidase S1 domain-containing protein n=1 Tax=Chilo suppressalis TaxID=168631 RepID=A0ABN8ATA0_CHISP|nr:unnamed protein product [Chilo suppressalis]
MHFERIVSSVVCFFLIKFGFVHSQYETPEEVGLKSNSPEEIEDIIAPVEDEALGEGHTFVALLDIVFQDGSKRTCSGAIIHDYVLVTAAHCFVHELDESVKPEITASFVVIGTKKMFLSGYEQYLPIERILTHPKYDGWSADISLVYTFAGMTSDKPGKIVRLAGEKATNQGDYNVTVYSWRHPKEEENQEEFPAVTPTPPCPDSISREDGDNSATEAAYESKRPRKKFRGTKAPNWYARGNTAAGMAAKTIKEKIPPGILFKYPVLQLKNQAEKMQHPLQWKAKETSKKISRYLTSDEESRQEDSIAVILMTDDAPSNRPQRANMSLTTTSPTGDNEERSHTFLARTVKRLSPSARRRQQTIRGWRRLLVTLYNVLYIEHYNLVSASSCKKILDNALAPRFVFNKGEVACYSSHEHILTDEDSGAPVVRHSKLVAITIGGAECDGDHVGVGLKISCYCSWIADNIPGGSSLICCKNCCDVKHTEPYIHQPTSKKRRKNKYLIK